VENTILNTAEEEGCFLAPETPAVTSVAYCLLVTDGFDVITSLVSIEYGVYGCES
jgi:hypothetical protein